MHYEQQHDPCGQSQSMPSVLAALVTVKTHHMKRVRPYKLSVFKSDTMLQHVAPGFLRVPFKSGQETTPCIYVIVNTKMALGKSVFQPAQWFLARTGAGDWTIRK